MRVPSSTYRLQLHAGFTLDDATRRLPYLRALGAGWVYLSPVLPAEPGSTHGYDVVAHHGIDAERGGREAFDRLCRTAHELGLGVLVDVVPNHVGVATPVHNAWWWDLLSHGRGSAYADAFDVDWSAGEGRVLLPVLGDGGLAELVLELPDDDAHYRAVHWTVADHGLNYRRFFAVNTLAGVRVEDPAVFAATHAEIGRWFADGLVDGLRVDHPDGLRDPAAYLDDLSSLTGGAYTLVEKILEPGERLVGSWACSGTTGYDVLGLIDRVLTDGDGVARLPFADLDWPAMVRGTKRAVADGILGSEVRRIVREMVPAPAGSEDAALVDALAEVLACIPVYRSYLPLGAEHLDDALAAARASRPDLAAALARLDAVLHDPDHPAALRFQQTSGMVMAKGVEDCAFYRYPRLTSLCEVGGDPSIAAVTVPDFHATMTEREASWPHAMTATSTHDTKRGEDVRARIAVLAEVPDVWASALERLQAAAPDVDPAFGCLLWQAVVGAWDDGDPDLRYRLHGYAEKAMREAGDRTTWTAPDLAYEASVHAAVDAAFDDDAATEVLRGLLDLVDAPGRANSLSAKLIALAAPGVPDVYQGSELRETSLVDPDNRRPVDFDALERTLEADLDPGDHAAVKQRLTQVVLTARRDRPELFTGYRPVTARGSAADHVVAFDRGGIVAVATRLPAGLDRAGGWRETVLALPEGRWHDLLTGRPASDRLSELLDRLPVALLVTDR